MQKQTKAKQVKPKKSVFDRADRKVEVKKPEIKKEINPSKVKNRIIAKEPRRLNRKIS